MSLVDKELFTLPEHMSPPSPSGFSGVRVTRSFVLCRSLFVLLFIVLSVLLRFTDSDYYYLWIVFNIFVSRGNAQIDKEPSWPWSYGSWIYNYLCNQCLSPLVWVRISIRARCTTLCDKVCKWVATSRWFSPGPPVFLHQ